jgi:hypothetical protein
MSWLRPLSSTTTVLIGRKKLQVIILEKLLGDSDPNTSISKSLWTGLLALILGTIWGVISYSFKRDRKCSAWTWHRKRTCCAGRRLLHSCSIVFECDRTRKY